MKGNAVVNLNLPLIQKTTLESFEGLHQQFINYDFLAEACFICGDLAHRCKYCPFSIHQRQLFLERTSTQRSRTNEGWNPNIQLGSNLAFSGWVPVPQATSGNMMGLLFRGMEKFGLEKTQ